MNHDSKTVKMLEQQEMDLLINELQEERDVLDSIMENSNAQIAYLDSEFNFIKVNSDYIKGSGKSKSELIGQNHFDLFPNEENKKLFESVRDSGQPLEYHAKRFEYEDQPARGVTYWDWLLTPVKDRHGEVEALVLSLRDVTDEYRRFNDAKYTVIKLISIIVGSIFIAEALIMGLFNLLPEFSPLVVALFDASLLTIVLIPLLYFLLFKPLIANISERKQAQSALQQAYEKMKVAVEERTGDLARANRNLKKEIEGHHQTTLQLEKELERSRQKENEVVSLLASAKIVLENDDFQTISREICEHCRELTGASTGIISLLTEDENHYEVIFKSPTNNEMGFSTEGKIAISGLSKKVYTENSAAYDNNFKSNESNLFLPQNHEIPENVLFTPLFIQERVVGFIGLADKRDGFSDDQIRLVATFAELVAIALSKNLTLESLENSEARFRSVAETASEAIININKEGKIIFWNKAASKIFGFTVDEIYNQPLTLLMPDKYHQDHVKGVERVVSTGKTRLMGKSLELTGLRKNGEEFPLELSLSKWQVGDDTFFTGIVRDITERNKIQTELLKSKQFLEKRVAERTTEFAEINEKLRQEISEREEVEQKIELERQRLFNVLDVLPASVHLLNRDHTILFANRYFRQQFGDQLKKPCFKINDEPSVSVKG
jgi:PAS domain S-box-containing protein